MKNHKKYFSKYYEDQKEVKHKVYACKVLTHTIAKKKPFTHVIIHF